MQMPSDNEGKHTPRSWSVPSLHAAGEAFACDYKPRSGLKFTSKAADQTPRDENTSGTETSSSDNNKSPAFVSPKKRRKAAHDTSWTHFEQERSLSEEEHIREAHVSLKLSAASLSKSFTDVVNATYLVPDWSAAGEEYMDDIESSSDVKDDNELEELKNDEDTVTLVDSASGTTRNFKSSECVASAAKGAPHSLTRLATGDSKLVSLQGPASLSGEEYLNLCTVELLENETPPKLWSSDASCAEDLTDQCPLSSSLKTSECLEGSKASLCEEGLLSDEEVDMHLANAAEFVVRSIIQEQAKAALHTKESMTRPQNLEGETLPISEKQANLETCISSREKQLSCHSVERVKVPTTLEKPSQFPYSSSSLKICKQIEMPESTPDPNSWNMKTENSDRITSKQHSCPTIDINTVSSCKDDVTNSEKLRIKSHSGQLQTKGFNPEDFRTNMSESYKHTTQVHMTTSDAELDKQMAAFRVHGSNRTTSSSEVLLTASHDNPKAPLAAESGRVLTISIEKLHQLRKRSGNSSRVPVATRESMIKRYEDTDASTGDKIDGSDVETMLPSARPVDWSKMNNTEIATEVIKSVISSVSKGSYPNPKSLTVKKSSQVNGKTECELCENASKPLDMHAKSPISSSSAGALVKPHVSFSRNSSSESMESSSRVSLKVDDNTTHSESICTTSTLEKSSNSLQAVIHLPTLTDKEKNFVVHPLTSNGIPHPIEHEYEEQTANSWVKKRARPHSANINRDALQEAIGRPAQVSTSSDGHRHRHKGAHKGYTLVEKACVEVRSDECISSASVVSPSGMSENVDVDSPSWSNESVSKYREFAKMRKRELLARFVAERRHREELDQLLAQLHDSYDKLLAKHAEAENTIDQLRLGKPMKFETSRLSPQVHFMRTATAAPLSHDHQPKGHSNLAASPKSRHSEPRNQESRIPGRRSVAVGANLVPQLEGLSVLRHMKDNSCQTEMTPISVQESFRSSVASLLLRANCLLEQVNSLHECVVEGITIDPVVGQQMCTYLWESLMSLQRDVVAHSSQAASLEDIALEDAKALLTKIQGRLLSLHPKDMNLSLSLGKSLAGLQQLPAQLETPMTECVKLPAAGKVGLSLPATGEPSCYGSLPASPSASSHSHRTETYADGDSGCHSTDKHYHHSFGDLGTSGVEFEPTVRKSSSSCFSEDKLESKSSNESECIDVVKTLLRAIHSEEVRSNLSKRSGPPRVSPKGSGNSDSDLEFMCGNSFNFPASYESNLFTANESKETESSKTNTKTVQAADENYSWTIETGILDLSKELSGSKTTVKSCESLLAKESEAARLDDMKSSSDTAVRSLSSQTIVEPVSIITAAELPVVTSLPCVPTDETKLNISPLQTPHFVDLCKPEPTDKKKILDTVRILSCQNLAEKKSSHTILPVTKDSYSGGVALQYTITSHSKAEEEEDQESGSVVNSPAPDQKAHMEELYCHAAEIQKVCDMLREKLHSLHTTPSDSLGGPESSKPSKEDVVMQLLEEVRKRLAGVTGVGGEEENSRDGRMEPSRSPSALKLADNEDQPTLVCENLAPKIETSFACGDSQLKENPHIAAVQLPMENFVSLAANQHLVSEKNGGGEAPVVKSSPQLWCECSSEAAFCAPSVPNMLLPTTLPGGMPTTTYVYLADDTDSRVVLEKLHDLIQELRHEILTKKLHTEGEPLSRVCSQSCQTDDFKVEPQPCCGVHQATECCINSMPVKCNRCEGSLNYFGLNDFGYFGGRSQVHESPHDTLVHYCGLHHIVQHQTSELGHVDVSNTTEECKEVISSNCPLCLQVIKPGRNALLQEDLPSSEKKLLKENGPMENRVCGQVLLGSRLPPVSNNDSSNSQSQPTSPDTYPSVGETVESYVDHEAFKYTENSTPTGESNRNGTDTVFCPVVASHHITSNSSTKTPGDTSSECDKADRAPIAACPLSEDSYTKKTKEAVVQFGVGVQTQFSSNSPWTEDDSESSEDETMNESLPGMLQLTMERSSAMAQYSVGQYMTGSPSFSEEQSWSSHHWMNSYGSKEHTDVAQTRRRGMHIELDKAEEKVATTDDNSREDGVRIQNSANSLYDGVPSESTEIKLQDAATLTSPGGCTDATNPNSCGASPELTMGSPVQSEQRGVVSYQSPQYGFPLQETTSPTSRCPFIVQQMADETAASQSSREFNLSTINEASDDMENESPVMSTAKELNMGDEESGATPMNTLDDQVAMAVCCIQAEEQLGSRPTSVLVEEKCQDDEVVDTIDEDEESPTEELQLISVGIQAEISQRDADIQAWPSRRDMDTQMTLTPHGSQETDAEVSTISKEDGDNTEEEATFPGSEASAPSHHGAIPLASDSSHCRKSGNRRQQTMSGSESPKERSRRTKNKRLGKTSKHLCHSSSSATSQAPTPDESSLPTEQHSCKSCARLLRKTEALANTMLKELKNEPLSCDESSEEDMEVKKLQLVHALDLANKIAKRLKHHSVQMLHSLNSDGDLASRDEI